MADFATIDQLAVRCGYLDANALTQQQQAQATLLLALASALIRDAAGREADWNPDPPSILLRAICLEMAARVMTNPTGARSESETLGVYQHGVSYSDGYSNIYLTDREAKLVRSAVGGTGAATTIPATTVDLLVEFAETGEMTP